MNPARLLASLMGLLLLCTLIPIASEASVTGGLTVTAHFDYASEDGSELLPCQGAYVQLWMEMRQGEAVQAYGHTNADGDITFTGMGEGNYYAVIYATDYQLVSVMNASQIGQPIYQWRTEWQNLTTSAAFALTILSDDRGAWNAYDAVRAGSEWLSQKVNWTRSLVTVYWPMEDWPHSHGDSIDMPESTADYAAIWDTDVLLHEYGHCVMYNARGGYFPDIVPVDPHYLDSVSSATFAFVEGWAEFFACAVRNSSAASAFTNLESTVYADSPFGHGTVGDWDGSMVEGAVANVLWDILDGTSEADRPYWATDVLGDQVDDRFSIFWSIFIHDVPDTMDDVWSYWEDKDQALLAIFLHARFDKDLSLPTNPDWYWSDHDENETSLDSSITIGWTGAIDNDTGIAGYSILWTPDPTAIPDMTIDSYGSYITRHLGPGTWYLKVRAIDNAGNAAEGAATFGPFIIGEGAIDIGPDGTTGGTGEVDPILQVFLIIMLAGGALLMFAIVLKMVRKPKPEDVEPVPQMVSYYMPPAYYYPPADQTQAEPQAVKPADQVRYCRNCGRVEIGDTFCPYCGYKLR
ncbi:MAG: hypothetical protein A4E32_01707 [Methanomassiliicoccales archaeon PtaU1.Bin124]|nr:MAG: hypothetical protein A4E32_01707 [Methanomassiliicoccales archaeon PtaU1.Bin124]